MVFRRIKKILGRSKSIKLVGYTHDPISLGKFIGESRYGRFKPGIQDDKLGSISADNRISEPFELPIGVIPDKSTQYIPKESGEQKQSFIKKEGDTRSFDISLIPHPDKLSRLVQSGKLTQLDHVLYSKMYHELEDYLQENDKDKKILTDPNAPHPAKLAAKSRIFSREDAINSITHELAQHLRRLGVI